ncbi:H-NS family nucleoid-associated regulatory protein [Azohydromonas australica]|uniref:H-NS family nucleoid-associated regulatory protein n=1 Tax=Azohydromonas australica TaxID=364039 RepID=UPI000418F5EE|nr:H-NS family nucleoid-associated regulatory protein [Azohydromonas australica]
MVRIGELRSELQELEQQASDMREATRLEALVKIRNIMRAQQLTIEDILPELRRPVRAGRD